MRTATRMAFMLTGTAIFVAAMVTSGAQANRGSDNDQHADTLTRMTMPPRAQPQPPPDRIGYVQARKMMSVATAAARVSSAPAVANFRHGDEWMESQLALATPVNKANYRSIAWSVGCGSDNFATQQRNASDGGRGGMVDVAENVFSNQASSSGITERSTRQANLSDQRMSQTANPEPAPVVLKFEAVIRIDLAKVGW